jgi:hypothetical protein
VCPVEDFLVVTDLSEVDLEGLPDLQIVEGDGGDPDDLGENGISGNNFHSGAACYRETLVSVASGIRLRQKGLLRTKMGTVTENVTRNPLVALRSAPLLR